MEVENRNPGFTRIVSLGVLIGLSTIISSAHLYSQELGANFNENLGTPINHVDELIDSKVNWVRGFNDLPQFFLESDDEGRISGVREERIAGFEATRRFVDVKRALAGRVNLIMSLKIPFEDFSHGVPDPGTQEMDYLLEAIEKFLISFDLGSNLKILVMGNEPMWENNGDAQAYGVFLNLFADLLVDWKAKYGWDFMVFAGSLNRISELPNNETLQVVMDVARNNENIDGLSLHIHARNSQQARNDIRVTREVFEFQKKLISTEFSMVRALNPNTGNEIGDWGLEYGYPADMKMFEWLNHVSAEAASGTPVSEEEILSFFNSRDWYPQNWYGALYDDFKEYEFHATTGRFRYGVGARDYDENSRMWGLGAVYNGALLGRDPETGLLAGSPLLYPDFRAISDDLYGTDPLDPIVNVASMNGALAIDWPEVPDAGGWGVSSSGFSGFTLTSLINGVEAGELSYGGVDDATLGVGGAESHGFARTINTSSDESVIEGIRIDLPALNANVGPNGARQFQGLTGIQLASLQAGTRSSNVVSISGFAADPDAAFLMGGGDLSFDGDSGTLVMDNPTEDGAILEFSNLDATASDSGVSLTLRNLTAKDHGHGFGLTQWRYRAVPDPTAFWFLEEPADAFVWAGTDVTFSSEVVSGGDEVLSFQWEKSTDEGATWARIDGADSASVTIESAGVELNRSRYRVLVNRGRERLTSRAAVLRVRDGTAAQPEGVVGYFRFEEGIAGEPATGVHDSSGLGNHLTAGSGDPVYDSGVPSNVVTATGEPNNLVLDVSGGESAVQGTDGDALSSIAFTDFTIEAWVSFHDVGGWQTIVGRDDRENQNNHNQGLFRFENTGTDDFRVVAWQSGDQNQFFPSDFRFSPNTWTHLAVVGNSEQGTVSLYANGELVGFHDVGFSGLRVPEPATSWTIGRGQWQGAPNDFVNGVIDEVRISSKAMTPEEFLNAGPPEPTPLESWRLTHFETTINEGAAADTVDFDGDGFDNLLEYALGTDPGVPGEAHSVMKLHRDGDFLSLSFDHIDDPSLIYSVESTDRLDGSWMIVESYSFNDAGTQIYVDDVSLDETKRRFLRLSVASEEGRR